MKKILFAVFVIILIFSTNVMAVDIDIGTEAIDRAGGLGGPKTVVCEGNPSSESGKITTIEVWAHANMYGVEVATFYMVSPNYYSTRDHEAIGNVYTGAKRTFEVDLDVEPGDYIGIYYSSGSLKYTYFYPSECGMWWSGADYIPMDNQWLGAPFPDRTPSLYGIGHGIPEQVTNVQATDGVHTDKVRVTWDPVDWADKYYVWNGSSWIDVGDVTTWDHTGAPAPTITKGTITATDGVHANKVVLDASGYSTSNGSSISYKVKAWNDVGYGPESASNSGYRGVGALVRQWQKSAGDSNASYSNISGASSDPYDYTGAPAGSVPGTPTGLAATDGAHIDKVALTWSNVSGGAGAGRYYRAKYTATGATTQYTAGNRGYRKAYTSTNTQVKRDAVELGAIGSLETSYDDTEADAPTITVGTASASNGTSVDHVTLSIAGESANDGTTHDYYVRTANAASWGDWCSTNTGYRGVGTLTYQWQRSSGDSDADYSNIDGATTDPYDDTGAPENGDGRYYKCVENASGASQQVTNNDRGYRIAAGWPHKWNSEFLAKFNGVEFLKWNGVE